MPRGTKGREARHSTPFTRAHLITCIEHIFRARIRAHKERLELRSELLAPVIARDEHARESQKRGGWKRRAGRSEARRVDEQRLGAGGAHVRWTTLESCSTSMRMSTFGLHTAYRRAKSRTCHHERKMAHACRSEARDGWTSMLGHPL